MNQYNISVKDGIKLFVIYCKFVNLDSIVRSQNNHAPRGRGRFRRRYRKLIGGFSTPIPIQTPDADKA
jgi:hypothetical protein